MPCTARPYTPAAPPHALRRTALHPLLQLFERVPVAAQNLLMYTYVIEELELQKECHNFGVMVGNAFFKRLLNLVTCHLMYPQVGGGGGHAASCYQVSHIGGGGGMQPHVPSPLLVVLWPLFCGGGGGGGTHQVLMLPPPSPPPTLSSGLEEARPGG